MEEIKSIKRDFDRPYTIMQAKTPFAQEFNKRMGDYWVRTGEVENCTDLILGILIDEYNKCHPNL